MLFALALVFATGTAGAEPASAVEPRPVNVGARVFMGSPGIFTPGYGVGVAYSLLPELAVGAQHLRFQVDQGGDPDNCDRCMHSGNVTLAFAEGRAWPAAIVTPYARLGAGLALLEGIVTSPVHVNESVLALNVELGLELHYDWASLRAFVFDVYPVATELDEEAFLGYGAELGVRF